MSVLEVDKVSIRFGGVQALREVDLRVGEWEIVGIIGPNGAGKTTLMRLVAGLDEPDSGSVELGPTVEICFADQNRQDLDDNKTIYQNISEGYDVINVGFFRHFAVFGYSKCHKICRNS